MEKFYTSEKNTLMLISLMKAHGIRKVVASPGTINLALVASIQQDSFFQIYSSVDERSAAYIACGLAAESGEPVALSCTGATASRNYMSGLTEAYYRKLPVLAITSAQHIAKSGQNLPQIIDRTQPLKDIVKLSVQIPTFMSAEDEWLYNVMLNNALLELRHRGGGPVHINLVAVGGRDYSVKELPDTRVIKRICYNNEFPLLKGEKIGVYVGSHKKWSEELTKAVDEFCEKYNGAVFCDHTSNYKGKYKVLLSAVCRQKQYRANCCDMDVMIHLGDVSGDYSNTRLNPKKVWRVNIDGEVRDTFKKLEYVFEMEELDFFEKYVNNSQQAEVKLKYYNEWINENARITSKMEAKEIPFSNLWVAKNTINRLPGGSVLHLGILNSLRSWNFYDIPENIEVYSNTGGFGIDGNVSTLFGASLANPDTLFFGVVGDLAFFYDMNVLGNRDFGNNVRLMVVNNGRGTEFRNYSHSASQFGSDADKFVAAAGHFGKQSPTLIMHYAEDLGFEYYSASSKEEYLENVEHFINPQNTGKSVVFEIFTDSQDESDALEMLDHTETTASGNAKQLVKGIVGERGISTLKKLVKK